MPTTKDAYHIPGVTDLVVIRKQAEEGRHTKGRRVGQETMVHVHPYGKPCEGYEHEMFPLVDDNPQPWDPQRVISIPS